MKHIRNNLFSLIFIIIASVLVSILILFCYSDMENIFYDSLFNNFRESKIDDDPIIIAIDQNTLNKFSKNQQIIWPWPRDIYKPIVDYLTYCEVSVISFDILFTSPGIDRNNTDGALSDSLFALSMNNSKKSTLAMQFEDSSLAIPDRLRAGFLEKNTKIPDHIYHCYKKASLPIDIFQKSTELLGAVNIPHTSSGIIRKLPLLFVYQGNVIPHLSLSTYMLSKGINTFEFNDKKNSIVVGNLEIPVDKHGNYLINWYGEGGVNNSFQYYSFANILNSFIQWQRGIKPDIPPDKLKGKTIFIGSIAAGLLDMKSTPVSLSDPYPGIEIYTTMFKNFQNRDFLHHFPVAIWFVILVMFFIMNSTVWQNEKFLIAIPTSIILIITPLILSILLFRYYAILFPVVAFESGLVFNLVLSIMIGYFWAGKKNRKLRKHFSRYLEPRLVKMMAESSGFIETAGDEVVATVLFTDIKDFTKISETLNSKKIVYILNKYFEHGEKIIFKNNGMLDKYTGDGLMALFGVPLPNKNHAISACNTIIDFDNLENINLLENSHIKFQTRVGIHTGPLVAGNIGSSRRVDFTAIGSTVNIAARLEQVNKVFNTTNIISSDTCDLVNRHFACRDLDYYSVKGIKEPLHIYTVLCKKEYLTLEIEELLKIHNSGLENFRNKDWNESARLFNYLKEKYPKDKISEYFIKKCIDQQKLDEV